ncbi:hypothetical protein [Flagellimonas sp.]|uniref:hypothetical protein n=1 Tax=Flagellimonas sp. TaxID=2058762 RepID=UPI003BA8AE90
MDFNYIMDVFSKLLKEESPNIKIINETYSNLIQASISNRKYFNGTSLDIFIEVLEKWVSTRRKSNPKFIESKRLIELHKKYTLQIALINKHYETKSKNCETIGDFVYAQFLNEDNLQTLTQNLQSKVKFISNRLFEIGENVSENVGFPDLNKYPFEYHTNLSKQQDYLRELELADINAQLRSDGFIRPKEYELESSDLDEEKLTSCFIRGLSPFYNDSIDIISSLKKFEQNLINEVRSKGKKEISKYDYRIVYYYSHIEYNVFCECMKDLYSIYLRSFPHGNITEFLEKDFFYPIHSLEELCSDKAILEYMETYDDYDYYKYNSRDRYYNSHFDIVALHKLDGYNIEDNLHFYKTYLNKINLFFQQYFNGDKKDSVSWPTDEVEEVSLTKTTKSTIFWSSTQTDFMELVKALIESGSIKDSTKKGKQKELIQLLSNSFNIKIKNPDKLISDIKKRNNGSETLLLCKKRA